MCPASVGTSRARSLESGEATLWALLVGVNHYADQRLPALSYSALDCQGLAEAIAAATRSFPQKTILVHHDFAATEGLIAQNRAERLLPDQVAVSGRLGLGTIAKLRNIAAQPPKLALVQESLRQLVQGARPQDMVLFYFSGHGILEQQQAVLCLTDTERADLLSTGLSLQSLLHQLSQCRAQQQIVWLDACHSGGLTLRDARPVLPDPTPQLVEVLQQQAARSRGFYALLSCDHNQLSWEFPELGHGVFTYYLMRGLLGEAADAEGVIEADALYKYVYYQTLRYIDKTNQQLRLINQQKRGRGEQLHPEYSLQTPKRIVEGIGELIIGAKPELATPRYPRQALLVDGLPTSSAALAIGKILRSQGSFELTYLPQPGKELDARSAIQTCLHPEASAIELSQTATVLLYLRGQIKLTATGDDCLMLRHSEISRSWLRQELRRSPVARQVLILDCPGAVNLEDWIEDLQISPERGQCLIAVAAPASTPDWFAQVLLETLNAAELQSGLSMAGWIAQIQARAAEAGVTLHLWLSGSQGVIEVLPGKIGKRGSSEAFDLGICPYLGLRAFSEEEAAFFFGREALVQQLSGAVMVQPFLAVVGASGSGKSSLVQAGLIAQLRQGKQIPGSNTWWISHCRPGAYPLTALAQCLGGSASEQLEGILYQGVESLVYWLRSRPEPMVLLLIDQFEELFTLAAAEDRQRFLELMLGAIQHADDRFKLVITLRSDFVAPCLEYPALARFIQQSSLLVPSVLDIAAYREIILRPAEKVGLEVEPELVEVLLQELSHTADLPLLEFALEQLWEHRRPGILSLQVYQQQIGGLRGALERRAQGLYDSLTPPAQDCARWIFLALTQLGEGTEDTRRRIAKSDLTVKKYAAELVEQTLQALVAAKLVVVDVEAESSQPEQSPEQTPPTSPPLYPLVTVEVAHEILIRHWSTLRWWLEENRSRLRAQRQIEQAAQQWRQSGKQTDFLLRGVRLDAAEELYVKYTDELSLEMQQFIEAGLAERQRQQRQLKRQLRRTQAAVLLIGTLGLAAAGFGGFAYWQRQRALLNQISTLNALSESQLLDNQQLESLTTSLKASQQLQQIRWFGVDAETAAVIQTQTAATLQQAVHQTQEINRLSGHSQRVTSVTVSGQQIASGSEDGTVRLWKIDGTLLRILKVQERVTDVAFGFNGQLAAASADGLVHLWNADGRLERTLNAGKWVTSLAFSANGKWLAIGSRDKTVKLWRVADGRLLKTLSGHQGFVNSVSFSLDSKLLASGGEDGIVRLWQPEQGKLLRSLAVQRGRVTSVTFGTDDQLAAAGEDQTMRLWRLSPGAGIQATTDFGEQASGHTKLVHQIHFSPDGQQLISASADGTLKLWRRDGKLLTTFKGHGDAVLSAAFSEDGNRIVSAGADKTVRAWAVPPPEASGANAISAGTAGRLATAGWDGKISLWQQGETRQLIRSWQADSKSIAALSFSPDGQQIASAGDDKIIKIWNLEGRLQNTLTGHTAKITSLSFSPNGQMLASASEDKTVRLWQVSNGQLIHTLTGHQDGVSSVAWQSDGQVLASGSYDHTIKLWKPDGTLLRSLNGHQSAVSTLAFSLGQSVLASASWDNTVKIWSVTDGTLLHTLKGHQDGVTSLVFSSDGKMLASGSADRLIKLWNPADGSLIKTLLGAPDRILSLTFADRTLISAGEASLQDWDLNLSELRQQGCQRVQNYLKIAASDQSICR
jgi:WD40 repeat protein/uncharacterized caspase-like protein